jgi:hypothetical protein
MNVPQQDNVWEVVWFPCEGVTTKKGLRIVCGAQVGGRLSRVILDQGFGGCMVGSFSMSDFAIVTTRMLRSLR